MASSDLSSCLWCNLYIRGFPLCLLAHVCTVLTKPKIWIILPFVIQVSFILDYRKSPSALSGWDHVDCNMFSPFRWISVLNNAKEAVLMQAFGQSESGSKAVNQSVKELTGTIMAEVKRLPGNHQCCDCGAPGEWMWSVNVVALDLYQRCQKICFKVKLNL